MFEERCYRLIYNSGLNLLSTENLFKALYGSYPWYPVQKATVWTLIGSIRKKLGTNSIITEDIPGQKDERGKDERGYITRRARIEANVGNRSPVDVLNEVKAEFGSKHEIIDGKGKLAKAFELAGDIIHVVGKLPYLLAWSLIIEDKDNIIGSSEHEISPSHQPNL